MELYYRRAKVVKVVSYNEIDLSIDLGFNLRYRDKLSLLVEYVSDIDEEKAKDCLVALIGGHRIIIKSEKIDNVYKVHAFLMYFVPIKEVSEVVLDRKLPSIYKLMRYAKRLNFNAFDLYSQLGRRGKFL
jgi:uncharacterized protein YpbB